MKLKSFPVWSALALLIVAAGCQKKSPSTPSEVDAASNDGATSVIDSKSCISVTSPSAAAPADNAQVKLGSQPISLFVTNGVTTGKSPLTYLFEVASEPGFTDPVFSKEGVQAGGDGQTSLAIDKLPASRTYFWRVRSGGANGPASKARRFTVGPEVTLQTPTVHEPLADGTVPDQPTLSVNNVQRTGPAGRLVYRFEVAEDPGFGSIVYSANENEMTNLPYTAHAVTLRLAEKTYYWRAQASDPSNGVTTPFSTPSSMRVQKFSLTQATILDSPLDNFAHFPETTKITRLVLGPTGIHVEFTKKNGPGRWPDIIPPGFSGAIQYCLGLAFRINGRWYASAPIEMWHDRYECGGPPSQYALNWFYDPNRWSPMTFHQPKVGETIGFFVVAGDVRGGNSNTKVQERSNVVLIPMPGNGGASYTF
jgi:hypothetical protein